MTTYFGFAIADSMLPPTCDVSKKPIDPIQEKAAIESAINCCNAAHGATIEAASKKFGLALEIPEKPPMVSLVSGDSLVVMSVRGLPRLAENRHYTPEEIESATFAFSRYEVK